MQKALHVRTTVLPGGKIEIVDQELPVGESVDVVVSQSPASERRSAVDILAEAPGRTRFQDGGGRGGLLEGREGIMGPLILPPDGSVYVDANAIIYSVERVEPYHGLLAPMWEEVRAGRFTLANSELVALETLVKPLRDSNARLELLLRSVLVAAEMELIPATLATWEGAARIRAETGLATPDALHAATALSAGCTLFITNDADFRQCRRLARRRLGRSGRRVERV